MSRSKVVALNFGAGNSKLRKAFPCEVERSKRKTLALHVTHKKVVVRCPYQAVHSVTA